MSQTPPKYIPKRPSPLSSPVLRGLAGPSNQVNETNRHDNLVTYFIDDAGQMHGAYTVHTQRGRLLEKRSYKHGLLEGPAETYYDSGKLMSLAMFSANRLHGDYKHWAPNGQLLSHERYAHGKKDGVQEGWYLSGQLWQRCSMVNGVYNGKSELYDSSGNILEEYNYKDGARHGVCLKYLGDGRVREMIYTNGVLLRSSIKKPEDLTFDFEVVAVL